jgi:hypothetical protein
MSWGDDRRDRTSRALRWRWCRGYGSFPGCQPTRRQLVPSRDQSTSGEARAGSPDPPQPGGDQLFEILLAGLPRLLDDGERDDERIEVPRPGGAEIGQDPLGAPSSTRPVPGCGRKPPPTALARRPSTRRAGPRASRSPMNAFPMAAGSGRSLPMLGTRAKMAPHLVPEMFAIFAKFAKFAIFDPALAYPTRIHRQALRSRSKSECDFSTPHPALPVR